MVRGVYRDELFFPEAAFAEIEDMLHIVLCIFYVWIYAGPGDTFTPVALFFLCPCDLCVAG